MSRFPRNRAVVVFALAAVAASGCVKQNDPGVAIDPVQARLVFGIKEEAKPTPTSAENLEELVLHGGDTGLLGLDFVADDTFVIPFVPPKKDERCPMAPGGGAVKVPAENYVLPTLPKEGLYLYRVMHRVTDGDGAESITKDIFVPRAVRKVTKVNDTTFTYETLDPGPDDTTVVTVWQVKEAPPAVDWPTLPAGANPPRSGDPERGLVMKKRYVLDATGTQSGDYRPFDGMTGLLILPLKVTPGEEVTTAATDRRTLDTYFAVQKVNSTRLHNACGEWTDGWHVVSDQTFTSSNNDPGDFQQKQIHYIVGTQFGALILWEEIAYSGEGGTNEYLSMSLASLKIAPLPDALKN